MLQNPDLSQHLPLFQQFKDHPNYLQAGTSNLPVVSSYGGYNQSSDWSSFKSNSDVYLLLNLDDKYTGQGDTSPYFTDPSVQLSKFNCIVDGYFSWESTWPASDNGPTNVSAEGDVTVIEFAHNAGKDYMMGEVNLPERMEQILAIKPDFAEFITWNDAGESHYIGNVWNDGYDPAILAYANNDEWPHYAWQPLVTSFINAYKAEVTADQMQPPSDDPIGVIEGMQVQITSGDTILTTIDLKPGLNYAADTGMVVGTQKVNILNADGTVVMGASSLSNVTDSNTCNFNYNVVGLQK
ncbi:hypothetical protein ACN42_g11512 [Penicillium freii]|uniref:Uncharacterized protein n=1 Tax=Penicillium freii TaxID=48697 RepID=A0A101M809_PENFR|nr:hypothetical protein ACN42_g11512 [Penicillium freii]